MLWAAVAISSTLISHSGYHLPFLSSPEKHDFHHKYFNVNYGTLGLLDYLHGTDVKFRKNVAFLRDHAFFSLTPMREQIPEPAKRAA
mmetsp:Transcript_7724/g.18072  ORF Transcript_7724/g.18072 Transcript_7724/m.18072 type:complete len:87 (-) Transcript_7724:662-922(-)